MGRCPAMGERHYRRHSRLVDASDRTASGRWLVAVTSISGVCLVVRDLSLVRTIWSLTIQQVTASTPTWPTGLVVPQRSGTASHARSAFSVRSGTLPRRTAVPSSPALFPPTTTLIWGDARSGRSLTRRGRCVTTPRTLRGAGTTTAGRGEIFDIS